MDTATLARPAATANTNAQSRQAPPLRLPRMLLQHLSKPLNSEEGVDSLVAQIRLAEWRGLL